MAQQSKGLNMRKKDEIRFTIDMPKDTHKKLKMIAAASEVTLRKIMMSMMEVFIKEMEEKNA